MTKAAETKPVAGTAAKNKAPFFSKDSDGIFSSLAEPEISFFSPIPKTSSIQTKLSIGQSNDTYEQEADAVADQVVQKLSDPQTVQAKAEPTTPSVSHPVQPESDLGEKEKKQENEDEMIGEAMPELQKRSLGDGLPESPENNDVKNRHGTLRLKSNDFATEKNAGLNGEMGEKAPNKQVQAKLNIGAPDDIYEKEADAVANQVVQKLSHSEGIQTKQTVPVLPMQTVVQTKSNGFAEHDLMKKEEDLMEDIPTELQRKPVADGLPDQPPPADDNHNQSKPVQLKFDAGPKVEEEEKVQAKPIFESETEQEVQRKCAECETEDKERKDNLQKKELAGTEMAASASIESGLSASKGSGQSLPESVLGGMGSSMGADFSNVKIHTDSSAVQMSKDLNAQAFTHGSDIYFNSGKYNPESTSGQRLLAHELTHTIQQNTGVSLKQNKGSLRLIQRQPNNAGGTNSIAKKFGDIEISSWIDLGQIGIGLYGEPWIQVRWDARFSSMQPVIRITTTSFPQKIAVEISAEYNIDVTVNKNIEAKYAKLVSGETEFDHDFRAKGNKITINRHLKAGYRGDKKVDGDKKIEIHGEEKEEKKDEVHDIEKYEGHTIPGLHWNPELHIDEPGPDLLKVPDDRLAFYWLFDNDKQLEAFIATWPKWYWITTHSESGKYLAIHFDEPAMQAAANKIRKQDEPGFSKMYINGEAKDAWLIYDMFFDSIMMAHYGGTGDTEECLVYRHGDHSFGRVSLAHGEALSNWSSLDKSGVDDLQTKKVGEYPFEALFVRGSSGSPYEIGLSYLEARDKLFIAAQKKRREESDSYNPFASSFGWDDVLTSELYQNYLRKAIDRPGYLFPTEINELMYYNSGLSDEAGEKLLNDVEQDAKMESMLAIEGAISGLNYYTSEESAQRLVQKMIFMTDEERNKTLQFIGVPEQTRFIWAMVLSIPEWGMRIWMGEDIMGVSTAAIAAKVNEQITELKNFQSAISFNEVQPLYMEGDFGNNIREIVYKRRSFDLAPEDFPHETGSHPTIGTKIKGFEPSEAGYLFAKAAANDAKRKRRIKYFKIFALVIASVVLVLLAGAAGAALAGLAFGTAATGIGLVGFVATELVVSAAIVTAVSPAMQTFILSGGSATAGDYKKAYSHLGTDFGINLISFGFFKALGAATRALAVAGAGGKEAFEGSRAWQAADIGLRVTTSSGAFLGIGVLTNYMKTGKVPEGEQMNELLFETALSVVLLEVGSYATRGPMRQLQEWARLQRLGDFAGRMDSLLIEANTLRSQVAEFAVRPNAAKDLGPELTARQKDLLLRQKKLVEEMSKSFRTRPDGKQLGAQLDRMVGDFDLLINQLQDVQFFTNAKIRPAGRATSEEAVFTYERGQEKEIIDYYGKDNVKEIEGGGLEVTKNGRKLTFRASTELDPSLQPDGTREPQALESWRSLLTKRRMLLLEKAFQLAETSSELQKIQESDPSAMKDKDLLKFEKMLDLAEAKVEKMSAKKPAVNIKDVNQQPGESTEDWRLRLVEIKNNLIRRGELLGLESVIEYIRKLPTSRPNLVKDTLARHAEAFEKTGKEIDREWGEKFENEKARQAIQPEKDTAALKSNLELRQAELRRRARSFGSSDSQYIKEATKRVRSGDDLSSIREREAAIEKAEARLDKAAAKALENGIAKFGKATIDAARKGELAGLSDQQVGDALRMLRNAESLTPAALRGAFYASLGPPAKSTAASPVPLENAVAYARSTAELNFVLESYLAISEAGIEGSYQLMRDAATSPGKWKGAVWQLDVIRNVIGTSRVKAVEVKVPGREIDIVLNDGTRIETKDWDFWDREKVQKQFGVDLEGATSGGTNADGLKDIIWMFRDPIPVSRSTILTTMKSTLETFIKAKLKSGTINESQAELLRDAFKNHKDLLSIPKIDASHVAAPEPIITRPPLPPVINQKDKDKDEK